MHVSTCLLSLLLMATTGTTAGAASDRITDRREETYTVGGRPSVEIGTDDGDVIVETWERRDVMVRISTVGWRIGRNDVRVEGRQTGDHVAVEARTPRWEFMFTRRSMRIELWVPRDVDLDLKTQDGHVTVPAVSGRIAVHTGDGSITATGARGDLKLWTGDGRITGRDLEGSLDAHTGDGNVVVDGRFNGLTLRSGDGTIVADVHPGSVLAEGATASTGDGRLTIRVPSDLKADLEAFTGDGTIDVDLPLSVSGRVSRSRLRGTLNGGGPLLKLRSGDGSIRVEAR